MTSLPVQVLYGIVFYKDYGIKAGDIKAWSFCSHLVGTGYYYILHLQMLRTGLHYTRLNNINIKQE